jgi:hypothetical protein
LVESQERVFSTTDGVEIVPLGLYIVRGDNMYALRYGYRLLLGALFQYEDSCIFVGILTAIAEGPHWLFHVR